MPERSIVLWLPSGKTERWHPTTLDRLGKSEEFLEDALANSLELLGLESRRTGVHGPFRIFRQLSMQTPSGRGIFPDIVVLAASGHVIVVEVKRYVNPELKDRAVIAQIIDYASSFAALSEQQLIQLFDDEETSTWTDCVATLFPDDASPDELADVLQNRMQRGELNLVIACDKIPPGLPDVVSGIASQSALGFELDLVEIVPYVREISETTEILFVPSTRLSTEIVSRTAVTVTYREGDPAPSTTVTTTSIDDIEENVKAASRRANPKARTWTAEEVETEFRENEHPVTLKLLDFVKSHTEDGTYVPSGKRQNAVFGFFVDGMSDGVLKRRAIFNCVASWGTIYIYLRSAESFLTEETMEEFRRRLKSTFGDDINIDQSDAGVTHESVEKHLEEFQEIMLWLKSQAELGLSD